MLETLPGSSRVEEPGVTEQRQFREVTAETTSVFRADPQRARRPAVDRIGERRLGCRRTAGRLGPAGRQARTQRRIPVPCSISQHPAGRHPDSDIFLDDVTVSRRHAEFRLRPASSRWSTRAAPTAPNVNREPVDSAVLSNGDEVQIGKFRLVFLDRRGTDDGSGS